MSKYTVFNPTPYEAHRLVFEKIRPDSKVLDLGCASGYFAKELLKKNCRVWGIDADKEAVAEAKKYCVDAKVMDLDEFSPRFNRGAFDYILLLDVLEHLRNPDKLLKSLRNYLEKEGTIIISVPNVAFISLRLALLRGKFEYQKTGIMDESHLHFYTKKALIDLITKCGLKIVDFDAASGFSQITLIGKYLNSIPKYWQYRITKLFPTLLGYQFIIVCSDNSTWKEPIRSPSRCL